MFRTTLLVLLAVCSAPVAAETIVPVTIGGADVRVAVDDGALRVSEKLPTNFAVMQAGVPTNHLIEGFVSEADAKRMAVGDDIDGVLLEVQVLRNAEALNFTAADWAQLLPVIRSQVAGIDADALLHAQDAATEQPMTDAAGVPVKRELGKIGKPTLYAGDPQTVRFLMLIPATYQVNGASKSLTLECAGAFVRLNGKLVYLYAYRRHRDGEDFAVVRAALDHFADRAIALNTNDAQPAVAAPATTQGVATDGTSH